MDSVLIQPGAEIHTAKERFELYRPATDRENSI